MSDLPIIEVFDEAAATYDNVGVDFFTPMGAALVRAVAPEPGSRLLDVGCGRGAVLGPALAAVGPSGSVVGIDLAPGMVSRTAAAYPAADVRLGDAQAPDFPAGTFDVVTAGLVLFFLPDPPAALAAYRRLLRPGGRLGVTSFAAHDPRYPQAMKILSGYAVDPPPPLQPHPLFKTAATLTEAASAAGFGSATVDEVAFESRFADAGQMLRWIGSHMGRHLLDAVPPERRAEARGTIAAELGEPLTLTTRINILIAS